MESKLRFAVFSDSMDMEKWQERAIYRLLELNNVELSLVILNGDISKTNNNPGKFKKIFSPHLLFSAYLRLIGNKFKSRKKVSMYLTLSKYPQIVCNPTYDGKHSKSLSNHDVEIILKYKLDFILHFGFPNPRGEILNAARYGVWSFQHDDEQKYRGEPQCFWEIYNNDKITGAVLERLTDGSDGGIVLNKGYFPTIIYSYVKNLDRTYFSTAEWPAKICRSIINGNDELVSKLLVNKLLTNKLSNKTAAPINKLPNNMQMIKYLFMITYNCFKSVYEYLFRNDEWNIGIIDKPIYSVLDGNIEPKWLPRPSKGTFISDPFGKSIDGKSFVMVEDLDYHNGRANIAAMEISDSDMKSYTKKSAVELPCHMSYPYIIDYNNETYLIPETYESRKVVLLKAIDFPNEWEQESTLIQNFAAVDPTVFYYNDYWWLMCTNRDTDSNSDLYIWYSKDLFGPFKQHNGNPVKTDIKSSRPGGTPFVHNGELYRPAQNSIYTYGGSLIINKVTTLTIDEFEEEEVLEIMPDKKSKYNKGIHTIAAMGDKTVIDGKRFVFIPDLLFNRCVTIIKKFNVPRLIPKLK